MVDSEGGSVEAQRVPGAAESVVDGILCVCAANTQQAWGETYHEANNLGAVREVREIHSLESAR